MIPCFNFYFKKVIACAQIRNTKKRRQILLIKCLNNGVVKNRIVTPQNMIIIVSCNKQINPKRSVKVETPNQPIHIKSPGRSFTYSHFVNHHIIINLRSRFIEINYDIIVINYLWIQKSVLEQTPHKSHLKNSNVKTGFTELPNTPNLNSSQGRSNLFHISFQRIK